MTSPLCRHSIIRILASFALLAPLAAEAGINCTAKFSVPQAITLGALQFDVGYSAANGEPIGTGAAVSCSATLGGGFGAFNDDEGSESLHAGLVVLPGDPTPEYVASCSFAALSALHPSDFTISVLDTRSNAAGTAGG